MWKVHSVMYKYVAKWRAFFIYWSVWSSKIETLHIRLQFAYLLNAFPFFLLLTLRFLKKNLQQSNHISQSQFHLLTSMDLHHRWMWLFVPHPGNHGSCYAWPWTQESHHLSPCLSSQQCFCQNSYSGRATLWRAQQVSAFCPNPAQRYKTFSCIFLIVCHIVPDRKGKKLSR